MDISILILVLLVFLASKANKTVAVCSGPKRKKFALEFTDKTLVARLLRSPVAMDEMNCQFSCHANDFCDAYNFNTENNQCELLDGRDFSVEQKAKQYWKFRAQECEANLCKNSATCIQFNDKPKCLCSCSWKGELCDVAIPNPVNVISFPGQSVSDMVVMKNPFSSALSQLSVSMWAQIDHTKQGEHALVSYATLSRSNAILMILSPTTTHIIFNNCESHGKFTDSNQLITDNNWHHFSFTWENVDGKVVFYIDGVKRGEKISVKTGETIAENGALVIGQDQDIYLGGFQSHQVLKGNITSWNMWDRVLTASEISDLASKCPTQEGSLVKWSQLMCLPRSGNVTKISSPFCVP